MFEASILSSMDAASRRCYLYAFLAEACGTGGPIMVANEVDGEPHPPLQFLYSSRLWREGKEVQHPVAKRRGCRSASPLLRCHAGHRSRL